MRKFINYLRSCFCKHDWELLSYKVAQKATYEFTIPEQKWTYCCKKCGYMVTHSNKDEYED